MRTCVAILLTAGVLLAAGGAGDAPPAEKPAAPTTRPSYPDKATKAERAALDALAAEIQGAVVYARRGRIRKVVIGVWKEEDLAAGEFARWSRDGKHLAVYNKGKVYVVKADGSEGKLLVEKAERKDGCPVEFHPNGREVVYWTSGGFMAVDVKTGKTRRLNAPGSYTGSACISADGKRMAARHRHNLYAIDLAKRRHRKYASGCSPGVSPDGRRVMSNTGGHTTVEIRTWEGKRAKKISAKTCRPDQKWDNHHWSNHNDYIAAQGEHKGGYAYVVKISEDRGTRVTWEERTQYPDVFVAPAEGKADPPPPAEAAAP
jgi:hypothetical protein